MIDVPKPVKHLFYRILISAIFALVIMALAYSLVSFLRFVIRFLVESYPIIKANAQHLLLYFLVFLSVFWATQDIKLENLE